MFYTAPPLNEKSKVKYQNMAIEFFNKPFEISPEEKITFYRFNNGDSSPFQRFTNWDLTAKAFRSSGAGIYGVSLEQIQNGAGLAMTSGFHQFGNNIVFMRCEASKKDIVVNNSQEISVSRGNILQILSPKEFADEVPRFRDISTICDISPESYKDPIKLLDTYNSITLSQGGIVAKWMDHTNDLKVHGYPHAARVERNAMLLSKFYYLNNDTLTAMTIFSFYHDLQRLNDGSDLGHGARASNHLKEIRELLPCPETSDKYFDKICFACENHTTMVKSGDLLVDICFDADRLDLPRIGIAPDPNRMATRIGAHFAENMDIYRAEFLKFSH